MQKNTCIEEKGRKKLVESELKTQEASSSKPEKESTIALNNTFYKTTFKCKMAKDPTCLHLQSNKYKAALVTHLHARNFGNWVRQLSYSQNYANLGEAGTAKPTFVYVLKCSQLHVDGP